MYYGITGAHQLSTWHGRQTLNDSCYLGQHVWMYPQEYIAYGAGSVHAIELTPSNNKPFGGELFLFGVDTRKGFIDKETDSESGLGDFSARKYDNELGLSESLGKDKSNEIGYARFRFGGYCMEAQDFGNFHYGLMGTF